MVLPVGGSLEDYAQFTRRYLDCAAVVVKFCETIPALGIENTDGPDIEPSPAQYVVASLGHRDPAITSMGSNPGRLTDPVAAGEMGFGFYAGFPLYLDSGQRLGMLAALDLAPRALTGDQMATLKLLAGIIVQTVSFGLAVSGHHEKLAANG